MNTLDEFNKLKPTYQAFTDKLYDLICSLLKSKNIKFHLIEFRTKEELSFASKIIKKNESFDSSEITDISGLRIITYYQKDIDIISELITTEFDIDYKNSIDKSKILKSNEFGYQSIHYIIQLKPNRYELTEWAIFKDLKAEIQIRTVLQHSWASISHELQYKKSYEIPDELKRKLYRLSGLFELADEQFGELKEEHNKIEKEVFSTNEKDRNKEINLITINHFIQTSNAVTEIQTSAKKSGFSIDKLPLKEQVESTSYKRTLSEILKLLIDIQITNLDDLEKILIDSLQYSDKYFCELIEKSNVTVWSGWKDFFVELILITKIENIEADYLISKGWAESFANLIINTSRKYYR